MADRRDWIKFVFEDFCGDERLQACPLDTQGFYIHLMRILNRSTPPGFMVEATPPLTLSGTLANLLPWHHQTISKHLSILQARGVLKVDQDGRWYSKRMYEDWLEYEENRKNGAKGGNPKLVNPPVNPPVKADKNREEEKRIEGEGELTPTPALRSFIDHWCQKIGPLVLDPQTSIDLGDLYRDFDREKPPGSKPAVDILCAEIDELAKRPPKNRNVKYFAGMIWGKLNE